MIVEVEFEDMDYIYVGKGWTFLNFHFRFLN